MDDLTWLRKLQEELWPPKPPRLGPRLPYDNLTIKLEATRTLEKEEFERVLGAIDRYKLVAEMICTNMFGGYGMMLYEQELYPGTGAQFLITLIEDHLPVPTRYDRIAGNVKEKPPKQPGCGRSDAWEVFSKYTHSAQNKKWLKQYRLEPSREQSHYDY